MPYKLIQGADYDGTDLPTFKVYDAEEYDDITVRYPRSIGEVWGVGFKGVSTWIPTGVRWQLTGSFDDNDPLPAGKYADAARVMIASYEGKN